MLFTNPNKRINSLGNNPRASLFARPIEERDLFDSQQAPVQVPTESLGMPDSQIVPPKGISLFGGSRGAPIDNEQAAAEASVNGDYGIERPQPRKRSGWETVMDLILPIVPGIGIGYQAIRDRKDKAEDTAMKQFNEDRDFRQKGDIFRANNARQMENMKSEQEYRNKNLGIAEQNAVSNRMRASKTGGGDSITDLDLIEAKEAIAKADKLGIPRPQRAVDLLDIKKILY